MSFYPDEPFIRLLGLIVTSLRVNKFEYCTTCPSVLSSILNYRIILRVGESLEFEDTNSVVGLFMAHLGRVVYRLANTTEFPVLPF